jgi:hypothetical protein
MSDPIINDPLAQILVKNTCAGRCLIPGKDCVLALNSKDECYGHELHRLQESVKGAHRVTFLEKRIDTRDPNTVWVIVEGRPSIVHIGLAHGERVQV